MLMASSAAIGYGRGAREDVFARQLRVQAAKIRRYFAFPIIYGGVRKYLSHPNLSFAASAALHSGRERCRRPRRPEEEKMVQWDSANEAAAAIQSRSGGGRERRRASSSHISIELRRHRGDRRMQTIQLPLTLAFKKLSLAAGRWQY
jgi:hypothetical protein